ncbi:MAG: UxaA family hydrolase [Haloarculaceae archaeon]
MSGRASGPGAVHQGVDERAFTGYDRGERGTGTRNRVLVLPSVICSHVVADRIAERVPEAVSAPHDHGCAQIGADNDQTRRAFLGLGTNPNVAGTVVVGLGCEVLQSDEVAGDLADRDVPVRELSIQGTGGTDECIERGAELASELVADARASERATVGLGDLTVGVVASDLRGSTIETADPMVGELVSSVVGAGGRVLVAGTERFTAHPDAALEATSEDARAGMAELLEAHRDQPARATRARAEATGRAFPELARQWAGLPIGEVVRYGDTATLERGAALVDAPARFEEAATGLAAAGASLVVHATGEGVPSGHPVVPVVKVSGDPETVAALPDDIDVDATEATPEELVRRVLAVADGEPCCAERHGLTGFAITRVGPSM